MKLVFERDAVKSKFHEIVITNEWEYIFNIILNNDFGKDMKKQILWFISYYFEFFDLNSIIMKGIYKLLDFKKEGTIFMFW